jgi:hypothetical protein
MEMPAFRDSIDIERPHALLTRDTRFSGSLIYRYLDNNEVVTVANIWYNQPFWQRVEWIEFEASRHERFADGFKKSPPFNMSQKDAESLAERHLLRAKVIRCEAARLRAAGDDNFPVAASRIELNYGELPH